MPVADSPCDMAPDATRAAGATAAPKAPAPAPLPAPALGGWAAWAAPPTTPLPLELGTIKHGGGAKLGAVKLKCGADTLSFGSGGETIAPPLSRTQAALMSKRDDHPRGAIYAAAPRLHTWADSRRPARGQTANAVSTAIAGRRRCLCR